MQTLDEQQWQRLVEAEGGERLTLLMPMAQSGPETQKNAIYLKNLLRDAERALTQRGLDASAIDTLLAKSRPLLDDDAFWQHQHQGLALYIDQNTTVAHRSRSPLPERMALGPRFCVLPLIEEVLHEDRLHVLALSAGEVVLYRVTPESAEQVDLPDVPASLDQAMSGVDAEPSLQFHTGTAPQGKPGDAGNRPAIFHGQGRTGDGRKDKIRLAEFCQAVDAGVVKALPQRPPLMLFASEPIRSIYAEVSDYPGLLNKTVSGNAEHLNPTQVRDQALSAYGDIARAQRQDHANRYREGQATDQTTDDLRQALLAAYDGQIQTLLVRAHTQQMGHFTPQDRMVETSPKDGEGPEDLLNLAAVMTLRNGGDVRVLPDQDMPTDKDLAAILRYAT